ncbi:MAG TPA: SRPBCC family protein [Dehalococcoidia bacterium]|nr:SRPBCC family protein [Dehalococcoidia bacterium]
MPRLDNVIDIKAPVDKVFAYVADVTSHPEWVKWTKRAEVTSLEHKGVGSTSAGVMQVGPRKQNIEDIVTEYKEGEFLTRRTTRGLEMTDRLSVLNMGDTTKVAWSIDYHPPMGGVGKLMDKLFTERLFDQLMKDSLTNLKERLETAR